MINVIIVMMIILHDDDHLKVCGNFLLLVLLLPLIGPHTNRQGSFHSFSSSSPLHSHHHLGQYPSVLIISHYHYHWKEIAGFSDSQTPPPSHKLFKVTNIILPIVTVIFVIIIIFN